VAEAGPLTSPRSPDRGDPAGVPDGSATLDAPGAAIGRAGWHRDPDAAGSEEK
jgi:hypothetical protein